MSGPVTVYQGVIATIATRIDDRWHLTPPFDDGTPDYEFVDRCIHSGIDPEKALVVFDQKRGKP